MAVLSADRTHATRMYDARTTEFTTTSRAIEVLLWEQIFRHVRLRAGIEISPECLHLFGEDAVASEQFAKRVLACVSPFHTRKDAIENMAQTIATEREKHPRIGING